MGPSRRLRPVLAWWLSVGSLAVGSLAIGSLAIGCGDGASAKPSGSSTSSGDASEVRFSLEKGGSETHFGVRLTFTGSGHTIEERGEQMMITVDLESDEGKRSHRLTSSEWNKIHSDLGVRWRVDEAPGFDPKKATFTMFRP